MNEKILVADEESANLKFLEAILTQRGFQVKTASSAEDALNYFKRDSFDLVITDVGMPGEDGLPLMRRIKELDEDVEVIILTGLATLENATEALRVEGAFDYLKKPLDSTDKLIHTVNQAIAKRTLRLENKALLMEFEKPIKKRMASVLKDHELLKREIAERKRAEGALRKSEQRYRALVESSLDGIIVVQDETILFVNRQLLKMFGYQKADDMVGHPLTEFVSPEHQDLIVERGRTREKGEYAPRSYEFKALRRDGGRFDAELSVGVITFEGQVARQAVVRDITERKRAEERLEHLNLVLYAIRKINLNIAKEKDRDTLLKATCENLVETRGYFNAWIVLLDEHGRLVTTAEAGLGKDFFPMVKRLRRGELTDCGRRASAQPEVIATEDPLSTCSGCPLADKYTGRGALTARMQHGGKNFGILSASILKNLTSDHEEQALFKDVADNIAFALHSIEEEERGKQAEEALKESEQRYRTLVENSTDAILMTDRERKIVTCNQAFLDLFGYKKREIEGKSTRIIHQSDKSFDSYGKTAYPAIEKGDFFRTEWEFMRKDGTIVPVETITSAIRSPDGSIPNYHAILRDITERKRAEKGLKLFRILIDQSNDAIEVIDPKTHHFLDANEKALQDLGYSREEFLSLTLNDIDPNLDQETWNRLGEELLKTGFTLFESRHRRKDGSTFPVEVNAKHVRLDRVYLVNIIRDITERKRAEEERGRLELQLLQSEKMASVGQLAAGVAHEINNPTGFVSSNLKTLSDYQNDIFGLIREYRKLIADLKQNGTSQANPAAIQGDLGRIAALEKEMDIDFIMDDTPNLIKDCQEGTERVKKIVIDLKDFAHPSEQKPQYADINQNLDSTLNIVWNELKYKATVTKEYGELPQVHCYPQQLNQVFMNLLVNAAQAIEKEGEIRISTQALDGHVEIKVSDTGSGIPKENLSRIFDPFFTTKEVGKGTGLGLNVAYNIIQKHKGTIDVESEVGKGTTFIIRLQVEAGLESNENQEGG
jgi:PAS domain S-box-containing protein